MSDKVYTSFKDYIEKRTVKEITNDYSEQHDEWRSHSITKKNNIKHQNEQESKDTDTDANNKK